MDRSQVVAVVCLIAVVTFLFCSTPSTVGQENKRSDPNMAPLDQYLMDRNDEIALARSAAPPSIAKDATVLVLGKDGFETAVQGTTGFVCNVDPCMDQ